MIRTSIALCYEPAHNDLRHPRLIAKHPGSGYDIAALAERSIAHFWPLPKSQLYSELTRLEDLGFVAGTAVRQDRFPDKRVYEVTEAGLVALREWLDNQGFERLRSKNAALLKFFFGKFMTPERLASLLQEYRSDAEQRR
ncbi:MAG: PadR family transcriptional regulator, partial [Actinobacteria bacterium]|nr:PadR family transcriptional regulator [Actinomycetota bacterium]